MIQAGDRIGQTVTQSLNPWVGGPSAVAGPGDVPRDEKGIPNPCRKEGIGTPLGGSWTGPEDDRSSSPIEPDRSPSTVRRRKRDPAIRVDAEEREEHRL